MSNSIDYFSDNYKKGYNEYTPDKKLLNYISNIKKYKNSGKLLDIGCAFGNFLNLAKTNNFEIYGIEPTDAINTISITTNLKKSLFFQNCIDDTSWGKFDVITAFDVLEHIPEIDKALEYIDSLLQEDGLFVFVVPVYDGIVGKMVDFIDKDPTHIWKISRYDWIELVEKKFNILEKIPQFRFPPFLSFGYKFYQMPKVLFNFSPAIMIICKKSCLNK